jgi:transcription initiation factor TFIIIB Brf1 subunit/transcription initiation factor TFIIB
MSTTKSNKTSLKHIETECEQTEDQTCLHENTVEDKHVSVCVDCGEEIQYKINRDKEWRYYGQGDSKHSSDPTRVQMRRSEDKDIFKDVENMGFSDTIIGEANRQFAKLTQMDKKEGEKPAILRGNSRKSIIVACIYNAYKKSGKPQTHTSLATAFGMQPKTVLKGIKNVSLNSTDSSIRTTSITPLNLVDKVMEIFSATKEQKQEIALLYKEIENKSAELNRSKPQSVSCALVYYWTCLKNKNIPLSDFAKKVSLSELTIIKIATIIANILKKPGVEVIKRSGKTPSRKKETEKEKEKEKGENKVEDKKIVKNDEMHAKNPNVDRSFSERTVPKVEQNVPKPSPKVKKISPKVEQSSPKYDIEKMFVRVEKVN